MSCLAVIVPSYRRQAALHNCLEGLAAQLRRADMIFVVAQRDDELTQALAECHARCVMITACSQVAALNAGLDAACSAGADFAAFTDDDAVPRPDWLARIEAHFALDSSLAGVGGRDITHDGSIARLKPDVGRVQWFGREICNHHLGCGPPRCVDTLKGANMAFRLTAIGALHFDPRLSGRGAEPRNDTAFCLALRRSGAKLVYDPALAVDHFPAAKPFHIRHAPDRAALAAESHNATLTMLQHLPAANRIAFAIWAVLCGSRAEYGLLQAMRFAPRGPRTALFRLLATLGGRFSGYRAWRCAA